MSPLTLTDRRIYNQLLGNAWDKIAEPGQHMIPKRELQNTLHKGTDRLEDSIRRLMSAIVQVRVLDGKKWVTKRVQLLGGNVIPDADDGFIRYDFQPLMREIISESRVFARLHRQIMFALSSKYSLALYEMIQKRGNMNRSSEEMPIDDLRNFMGVPPGKLKPWINFKNFAITPAVREVSDLSDFLVTVEPLKGKGKQFSRVRLSWERKPLPELAKIERELNFSSVGRKPRLNGTVETTMDLGGPFAPAAYCPAHCRAAVAQPRHLREGPQALSRLRPVLHGKRVAHVGGGQADARQCRRGLHRVLQDLREESSLELMKF